MRRVTTALILACLVPFGTMGAFAFAGANTNEEDPAPPTYC